MKKNKGNVVDLLMVCVVVLSMTIVMISYLNNMQLISAKEDVNQIARKYILRMETTGYLEATEKTNLINELTAVGVTDIDLSGTTYYDPGYGNPIYLVIQGKLTGKETDVKDIFNVVFEDNVVEIYEKRMSTAKN